MEIYGNSMLFNVYSISTIKRQRMYSLISAKNRFENMTVDKLDIIKDRDINIVTGFSRKLDSTQITISSLVFRFNLKDTMPALYYFVDDTKYVQDTCISNDLPDNKVLSYHIRTIRTRFNCFSPFCSILSYTCPSVKKKIPISINLAAKRSSTIIKSLL